MVGLPKHLETIDDVLQRHPGLRPYMKAGSARFEQVALMVVSQPTSDPDVTIYGLFYADRDNAAKNDAGRATPLDEVVQDYIAHNRRTDAVIYYSGRPGAPTQDRQHIRNFCHRFGRFDTGAWGQYGCTSAAKSVPLHRYRDAIDSRLPVEQVFRDAVAAALKQARAPTPVQPPPPQQTH